MNDNIKKIIKMSLSKKLGILFILLAVIGAAYFFLFIFSANSELTESQQEVDKLELEVAKKKGIAANLKKYRNEVKVLDQELSKALRELPDKKDIDSLLAKISDKAKNSGLEVELFQPATEKYGDFYSEIPVELKVNGKFHQVAVFFNEVGDLDRIVNLKEYSIEKVNKGNNQGKIDANSILKTTLTAASFRFLDENERKAREKKSKKKKK